MTWLSSDAWLDASGVLGAATRAATSDRIRAQATDLHALAATDPRRLAVAVGHPVDAIGALACELAALAPLARWPDPIAVPDPERAVAELTALAEPLAGDQRPVVVLDGPLPEETLQLLPPLIARAVHPRLVVLVPCDAPIVELVTRILAGYPRSSLLVATVTSEHEQEIPPAELPPELLPLALAGRCAAGAIPAEAELIAAGLARRDDASATVVCLARERDRRALVDAQLSSDETGAARLDALLGADPSMRWRALAALARWRGDDLSPALVPALTGFGADDFPAIDDPLWRGLRLPPAATVALEERAAALLSEPLAPDRAAALVLHLARTADRRRNRAAAVALVKEALERDVGATQRAALLGALAEMTGEPEACVDAVAALRKIGNTTAVGRVSYRLVRALKAHRRVDEARACCEELAAFDEDAGRLYTAANARMLAFHLAGGDRDAGGVGEAERARDLHRAIGNVRGELEALFKIAAAFTRSGRYDDARGAFARALELEQALSNPRNEAYCHYQLGQCAERLGRPALAADHYDDAVAAYEAGGAHTPPRVLHARARAHAAAGRANAES